MQYAWGRRFRNAALHQPPLCFTQFCRLPAAAALPPKARVPETQDLERCDPSPGGISKRNAAAASAGRNGPMRGRGAPRDQRRMHGIHAQRAPRGGSEWPTRGDVAGGYRKDRGRFVCCGPLSERAEWLLPRPHSRGELGRYGGSIVPNSHVVCRRHIPSVVLHGLWDAAGLSQTRKRTFASSVRKLGCLCLPTPRW